MIGVCPSMKATPTTIAGIATVALLLRNDGLFTVMSSVSAPRQVAPSPASTGEHTPGRAVF